MEWPPNRAEAWAYAKLASRSNPDNSQIALLETPEGELTREERAEGNSILRAYKPHPSALTIKTLSGQEAALTLVWAK